MRVLSVLTAAVMAAVSMPLSAQQVVATADVPVASPTGSGVRNLSFGRIVPVSGQTVSVDVSAAVAAVSAQVYSGGYLFDVSSTRGLEFTIAAPTQLTSAGIPALAVNANGTQYGAWCITTGAGACTLTGFNPTAAGAVKICRQYLGNGNCHPSRVFPAATALAVYVGGQLSVPATARAATYTGTVTLTITQVY